MTLVLYQAEWCPYSHRVRQRLTELGLDFVAKQVPLRRESREELVRETGTASIPVLVADDALPVQGADAILAYLNERFEERSDAHQHRMQALVEVPTFDEVAQNPLLQR